MNLHVQIELFGGPEDGREITLPIGTDGAPMSPLPVPSPGPADQSTQDVAWYEKCHRKEAVWIYRYTTPRTAQRSQLA